MNVKLLLPTISTWNAEIDRIGALLDVQNNPYVFPYHFLQVVLPGLGGAMVEVMDGSRYHLAGFLLPRGIAVDADPASAGYPASARRFTFRYHPLTERARDPAFVAQVLETLREQLGGALLTPYLPHVQHVFTPTTEYAGSVDIGRPNATEAAAIRDLHQEIWNSPPEYLYPTDIHCDDFGLGTSLVARVEDQVAGFLFGFYRFGGPVLPEAWSGRFREELRLESQVMGVSPRFRGMRLGNLLKRTQAEGALTKGINLVHWTADPLQYPNAALNFGLLRAVAFSFRTDYYPFRNDLNRVPASRFALTWLIETERVREAPWVGTSALVLDLAHRHELARVNDGCDRIRLDMGEAIIAIEIPANWVQMQQADLALALRWREATDRIFGHYVGTGEGQYVISGVAVEEEKRFLVGQRVDGALWEQLAH